MKNNKINYEVEEKNNINELKKILYKDDDNVNPNIIIKNIQTPLIKGFCENERVKLEFMNDYLEIIKTYENKLKSKHLFLNLILNKKNKTNEDKNYFRDVVGLQEVKDQIQKIFINRKLNKYTNLYDQIEGFNNTLLLYGKPGTGKTEISRAAANEANISFYSIPTTALINAKVGESEKNVKYLFDELKKKVDNAKEGIKLY